MLKIKIKNNLRLRFVVSFAFYALVIIGIFSLVVIAVERKLANEFFQRRLTGEIEHFTTRYLRNPQTPLPISEDINSYLGLDSMPAYLKPLVSGFADGVYTQDFEQLSEAAGNSVKSYTAQHRDYHDLFFGVKTLPDGKRIFIFIDFNFWHQKQHELEIHMFWAFMLVSIIGVGLGLLTGNRVISPLNRLMKLIEKISPENLPIGFSQVFRNDEFGALARTFESSFQRIQQFIMREHQFTRDASHELRTPVTVIKGAVELLQLTKTCEDEIAVKLVKRIERSTLDMETTIESLLWLARESRQADRDLKCELVPLVQNAMEQNQHLLTGKEITLSLEAEANPLISAPAGVLLIAISNLIRNACQYTIKGQIKIFVKADRIIVTDTGPGIIADKIGSRKQPQVTGSASRGFGLDIVNRLCERFDWQLHIESTPPQGTTISLIFAAEKT